MVKQYLEYFIPFKYNSHHWDNQQEAEKTMN
jgi:hypothetical protein